LPVVGQVMPGLTLAVMHSGVTLAPLIAECVAAEVRGQGDDPQLAPFRLARFTGGS
jgi:D-hydroxyproline dehydrogenase subunit beta